MSQWCHSDVTVMSQWSHNYVTMMPQCCHNAVTVLSQWYHSDVTMMWQWCRNDVTMMSWWCRDDVVMMSWWCRDDFTFSCFRVPTSGCHRIVSQWCHNDVTMIFLLLQGPYFWVSQNSVTMMSQWCHNDISPASGSLLLVVTEWRHGHRRLWWVIHNSLVWRTDEKSVLRLYAIHRG